MIDCPSDTLATLHKIPAGCVVFPWSRSENIRFKAQRCFHIMHSSWPQFFLSLKAVACVPSIFFLKHRTDEREWCHQFVHNHELIWLKTYNENNLPEKSIGHKERKKGFDLCFKDGPVCHLYDYPCCANTLGLFWFLVLPSAERSKRCQQAPGYPADQYLSRDENTALTSWGC